MHQTFYIDIDEEITSIVDRLRKTRGKEVIVVVPKRALLIQSIVNLKLLKKEAEKLGLRLGIVTQDKLGKLLVEKAGIVLSQNASDQKWESEEILTGDDEKQLKSRGEQVPDFRPEEIKIEGLKKERLKSIGSSDYYSGDETGEEALKEAEQKKRIIKMAERKVQSKNEEGKGETITNKELVIGGGMDIQRKAKPGGMVASGAVSNLAKKEDDISKIGLAGDFQGAPPNSKFSSWGEGGLPEKRQESIPKSSFNKSTEEDRKIEDFFYSNSGSGSRRYEKENSSREDISLSGKSQRIFLVFGVVLILAAVLVVSYLFIPKAVINITTKDKSKSADTEIRGDVKYTNIDFEKEIIPSRMVSVAVEASQSFSSTGSRSVSNKKARGTITIYNEYSSSPQPLVATTRFSTDDGKIFRLVSGVTIPGASGTGGEMKAGTIKAEVVADESGAGYNIEPTKFSIPGFKDSGADKYAKIYAKSEGQMQGGGSGSEELKSVSQADIDNAKKKILLLLDEKAKEEIRKMSGGGTIVLDEAVERDEAVYKLSNSLDEAVSNFEVSAQMNVKAIVFSENDLKEVVNKIIARSGGGKTKIDGSDIVLDYEKSSPDFEAETIKIKVHGSAKLVPDINTETIRKEILGKRESELEAYLSQYSDISGVEVTYWPSFISGKVPSYEKRVEVRLDN